MSALLMAIVFRGLTDDELQELVRVMVDSGARLEWLAGAAAVVDKHSTGGVGDKVSLVLAPLAAALGLRVPMMSGRGLGHTTGTLDKLEAIPGFQTQLTLERFRQVLDEVGCAMIGQTADIAPLDRRLYELRSVTGTVPCIPLIAASIMSKKLAEGLDALLLDVKVGDGAFLPAESDALELAQTMVRIGQRWGVPTTALVTAMDRPLGRAIGNAVETREALECLHGQGPADLRELVIEQAAEMLHLAGSRDARDERLARASAALDDGSALDVMRRLVEAQGGETGAVDDPSQIAVAPIVHEVRAARTGMVHQIHPRVLGEAGVLMGGGRTKLGGSIDLGVGFELAVRPSDSIEAGQVVARVYAADESGAALGDEAVQSALVIGDGPAPELRPLIVHRIDASSLEPGVD